MHFMDIQLDQEALDAAYSQINYYSNVPKHIRGTVSEFKSTKNVENNELKPAHLLSDKITVKGGKLNIPVFVENDEFDEFLQRNFKVEN